MTSIIRTYFTVKTFGFLAIIAIIAVCCLAFTACVTNPSTTNLNFAGTYKCTTSCTPADTFKYIIIGNSNSNNALAYLPASPGTTTGCINVTTYPAVVSGHNITAMQQNIYDACNHLYSYGASGTLSSDSTLTIVVTTAEVGVNTTVCTYVGKKQ